MSNRNARSYYLLMIVVVLLLVVVELTVIWSSALEPTEFYKSAPDDWQSEDVGKVLKYERVTDLWRKLSDTQAYRIMFVSRGATDGLSNGDKVFQTGMVYIPNTSQVPNGGWPILAWGHGTSGISDSSAPSLYPWLYPGGNQDDIFPLPIYHEYADFVAKVVKMGAIVTCPDYEGLGVRGLHPYLHIKSEGRSMIDAVRAAKDLASKLNINTSNNWAAAGHSQGGGASIGAAELADNYGSGLNLKATVAFAPSGSEMSDVSIQALTDPYWYNLFTLFAWGIEAIDTQNEFEFDDLLGPWLLSTTRQALSLDANQYGATVVSQHMTEEGDFITPSLSDLVVDGWQNISIVQRYLRDTEVGHRKATGPILVIEGTYDDVIYGSLSNLEKQLKDIGDDYEIKIIQKADHDKTFTRGEARALRFLKRKWLDN